MLTSVSQHCKVIIQAELFAGHIYVCTLSNKGKKTHNKDKKDPHRLVSETNRSVSASVRDKLPASAGVQDKRPTSAGVQDKRPASAGVQDKIVLIDICQMSNPYSVY